MLVACAAFKLVFIGRVAFKLAFMACVASSLLFLACVAFELVLGACRFLVSLFSWHLSSVYLQVVAHGVGRLPSLVS